MSALEIWLAKNLSWLGFVVMCVLGSIVAHIKNYESANVEWTVRQHFWGLVRRGIYGAMAGLMVYYLHLEYQWSGPLSYVITGIAAIFASDVFDFMWITGKAWIRKKLGLET
jgi:hypothetical protein